jgi:hypothetical protein
MIVETRTKTTIIIEMYSNYPKARTTEKPQEDTNNNDNTNIAAIK